MTIVSKPVFDPAEIEAAFTDSFEPFFIDQLVPAAFASFRVRCDEIDRELEIGSSAHTVALTEALRKLNLAIATAEVANLKAQEARLQ